MLHLTADELSQIVVRFDVPPGGVAFDSIELGVFSAQLLPRLKHAHAAGLPYALLADAQIAQCVLARRQHELHKLLDASAMFEAVPAWVNPMREAHSALRIQSGTFTFSDEAPARPLCLRSGNDLDRRWLSIKRAAQGLNGRQF